MVIRLIGVAVLVGSVVLSAQTKGTGTTQTKTPLPPPVHIDAIEVSADIRGNEGTEGLTNLPKTMPAATINGVNNLFLATAPGVDQVTRSWMNCEHTIAGFDTINDWFTCRLPHMPPIAVDGQTATMSELDPAWNEDVTLTYQAVFPRYIDLHATFTPHDATLFTNAAGYGGYAVQMFASYMPQTTDVGLYTLCVPSVGAPEQWCRLSMNPPGGSWFHVNASALPVDPAPASTFGFATTYKGNLKSVDYPRYRQPYYCGHITSTNMVYEIMFDRTFSATDQIRLTQFLWSVKDGVGNPAWDWQYVINHIVSGVTYGFNARMAVYPYDAATFQSSCQTEFAIYQAGLGQ